VFVRRRLGAGHPNTGSCWVALRPYRRSRGRLGEAAIGEVVARYELEINFDTIPQLAERHGLRLA
jgi:hypothetical protein